MSYLTQNVFELPHPEITGITTVDSETPFGDFSEYLIEISNIPLYDPEKPRYSIVYSYRKPSNNLNLDMQIPVNDCFAFLPLNKNGKFIKRRMTQFYVLLPYEERNFYLTIIDTMLEKVIFQCCVTNEMVDECKDDESLDFLWGYEHFQDDLVSVWQTQYLRVEACNRLKPDGVYRDYFSVSFPCNNSCHKEDFAVVLTRNEDDSEFDAIIVDGTNDIKENEEVRILSKFVKHRRGYVVFSVPIIERVKNPYFVNIVDGLTGRFYARMNTSRYDWLFKERAEVEDFEEPTIFNDSAIYQRWYKQHEALPVDLAKQRTLVFKRPTKFSVVITVDNENVIFLEDTLQSITVQTYGNYEVIVASSVPKSSDYWSYLSRLENSYNNLKFLDFGEKASCTSCYFEGGDEATGDYIIFLKSGDVLTDDALFEFKWTIDENDGDVNLLFCHEDQITGEGYASPSFNAWDPVKRLARNYNHSIFVFSRETFEEVEDPQYDIDGAENYYCMLFSKGPKLGVDRVLCHRRCGETSEKQLREYDKNGRFVLSKYLKHQGFSTKVKLTDYPGIYKLKWKKFPKKNHLVVIVNNCDLDVHDKIADWERCGWLYSIKTTSPKKILHAIRETCNGLTLYLENVMEIDLNELEDCAREAYWGGYAVVPKLTKPSKLVLNTGIITQGSEYVGYIDGECFTFEEGLDYSLKCVKSEDCVFRNCMFLRGYDVKNMEVVEDKIVTPGGILVDPTWDVTVFEDDVRDKRFVTENYLRMNSNNGGDNFLSWQMAQYHTDAWESPLDGGLLTNKPNRHTLL